MLAEVGEATGGACSQEGMQVSGAHKCRDVNAGRLVERRVGQSVEGGGSYGARAKQLSNVYSPVLKSWSGERKPTWWSGDRER